MRPEAAEFASEKYDLQLSAAQHPGGRHARILSLSDPSNEGSDKRLIFSGGSGLREQPSRVCVHPWPCGLLHEQRRDPA
jgi:hypothetical protein